MQIAVKGRNASVNADLRERIEHRFAKIARQVSPLAELEIEVSHERNPAIATPYVVEATLYLKGVTLRASDSARDPAHALNLCAEELGRQVKRHRDKRRGRREARAASLEGGVSPAA
jgi:putative sigma-54 modulation protein